MNQNKKDNQGSQFDSGFGGSMFGGGGQTNVGGGSGTPGAPGGEFGNASGFGGTNAVSQIFKEGGFAGDEKKKRMIVLGAAIAAVVACLGAVWFLFFNDSSSSETPAATTPVAAAPVAKTDAVEAAAAEDGADDGAEEADSEAVEAPAAAPATSGTSSSYAYNEEQGGPVVTVAASAAIEVSRKPDFSVPYVAGHANSAGQFRIPNPPPGKIYWRQQGAQGSNEITVTAPPSLGLSFSAPAEIAAGGSVSWQASGPVSYYRVELSADQSFGSVANVVSTSSQSAALKEVSPGSYFVRVGGLNKASGKWEFSRAASMKVN